MTLPNTAPRICIFAGEASGDYYAADLIQQVRAQYKDAVFVGMGGSRAAEAGMTLWHNCNTVAAMGITRILRHFSRYYTLYRSLQQNLLADPPDLLICVDFAGLNLRMAAFAQQHGIRCIYYIPPKVWAWHQSRIHKLRCYSHSVAVLYPFEADFFRREQFPVTLIRHPFLRNLQTQALPKRISNIAILPGSRSQEIQTHLQIQLQACAAMADQLPHKLRFFVFISDASQKDSINDLCKTYASSLDLTLVDPAEKYEKLRTCHAAIAVSGTVTLELAVLGIVHVIIYRTSWLNYLIARHFLDIRWIGLPNLILQANVVPELIQTQCNPASICRAMIDLLGPEHLVRQYGDLERVRLCLGSSQTTTPVGQWVCEHIPGKDLTASTI